MYDQTAPPNPAKPKVSVTLIVLIVILLLLAGGWLVDRRARTNAQQAHDKLDALLKREDEVDPSETIGDAPLTPSEVEKIMGRAPDNAGEKIGDELHTTFSWRGVFYRYTVYAVYQGVGAGPADLLSDNVILSKVALNEPPP